MRSYLKKNPSQKWSDGVAQGLDPEKERKCGIYTQWNFTQSQKRMKFCHLQVSGWNWRTSS
jgi:hypothetical protein